MVDLAAILTGVLGSGGAFGAAKFVWNKVEARFASIEKRLAACVDREREGLQRQSTQLIVIELLWAEVARVAPDAAVFQRAKRLLNGLRAELAQDKETLSDD